MNTLRNKVILIGRLGADPETRTIGSAVKLCKFTLATNETYTNQEGERVEETQWHQISIWGKLADHAESLLQKGSEVALEGKLVHRIVEDDDGSKKYFTEVSAHEFYVTSKRKALS